MWWPASDWINWSRRFRVERVLFLTHELLTDSLAGPAIRVWELAHILARQQPVTIGTPNDSPLRSDTVQVRCYRDSGMNRLIAEHQIVIAFGYLLAQHPVIRRAPYLVMDLYDPFVLENLFMHDDLPLRKREAVHRQDLGVVVEQLRRADFFMCASERQRDYWLGALTTANRVRPTTYAQDPTMRRLIDVVPFGVPDDPPRPQGPGLRTETQGIARDDIVILWGGGIWNWFDPLTAIRAAAAVAKENSRLKLYFMGLRHPNPELPQMEMARRAVRLAEELEVLDRTVFFRNGWVPYERRVNYLCEADLAISLHSEHVETRYAFRTRFLDYLWAGLPTIATEGDVLSDEMAAAGAAVTVPEHDVEAVAAAMRRLAGDERLRAGMRAEARRLAEERTWTRAAEPLLRFCRAPYHNPHGRLPSAAQPISRRIKQPLRGTWVERAVREWRRRRKGPTRST